MIFLQQAHCKYTTSMAMVSTFKARAFRDASLKFPNKGLGACCSLYAIPGIIMLGFVSAVSPEWGTF